MTSLPTLDSDILEAVRDFGAYPQRSKKPVGTAQCRENALADKIGKHWKELLKSTQQELTELKAKKTQQKKNEQREEQTQELMSAQRHSLMDRQRHSLMDCVQEWIFTMHRMAGGPAAASGHCWRLSPWATSPRRSSTRLYAKLMAVPSWHHSQPAKPLAALYATFCVCDFLHSFLLRGTLGPKRPLPQRVAHPRLDSVLHHRNGG